MKKKIIVIQFIIIICLVIANVCATAMLELDSSKALYKGEGISVQNKLDNMFNDIKKICSGNSDSKEVLDTKTGYSGCTFITGSMKNYDEIEHEITSVWKDGIRVKFYFPNEGYYSNTSTMRMNFGNKATFNVSNYGFFTKKSIMSVPSNQILTYVDLIGTNTNITNLEDETISKLEIEYADYKKIKVIPKEYYYLDSIVCTNADGEVDVTHKAEEYTTGNNDIGKGEQEINIKSVDNNYPLDSKCVISSNLGDYPAVLEEINASYHKHTGIKTKQEGCYRGTGTIVNYPSGSHHFVYDGTDICPGGDGKALCKRYHCDGNPCKAYYFEKTSEVTIASNYESYYKKPTSSCQRYEYALSCGLKEGYSCPSGYTLSGTKCQKYTCPYGGKLNTKTKMCEDN